MYVSTRIIMYSTTLFIMPSLTHRTYTHTYIVMRIFLHEALSQLLNGQICEQNVKIVNHIIICRKKKS